jgi:hypothetical protein
MHYTNFTFTIIYLYDIITKVKHSMELNTEESDAQESTILFNGKRVIATYVDFMERPDCLDHLYLYEFRLGLSWRLLTYFSERVWPNINIPQRET